MRHVSRRYFAGNSPNACRRFRSFIASRTVGSLCTSAKSPPSVSGMGKLLATCDDAGAAFATPGIGPLRPLFRRGFVPGGGPHSTCSSFSKSAADGRAASPSPEPSARGSAGGNTASNSALEGGGDGG